MSGTGRPRAAVCQITAAPSERFHRADDGKKESPGEPGLLPAASTGGGGNGAADTKLTCHTVERSQCDLSARALSGDAPGPAARSGPPTASRSQQPTRAQ